MKKKKRILRSKPRPMFDPGPPIEGPRAAGGSSPRTSSSSRGADAHWLESPRRRLRTLDKQINDAIQHAIQRIRDDQMEAWKAEKEETAASESPAGPNPRVVVPSLKRIPSVFSNHSEFQEVLDKFTGEISSVRGEIQQVLQNSIQSD
jgi:superoxide dismutase